jgi:phosphatidylinositol-3-phosphatase
MFRERRWLVVGALVCAMAAVSVGCSPLRGPRSEPSLPKHLCKGAAPPERYDHIVIVVMENKRWSDVLNGQGPWLTARKNDCTTATNYAQAGSPSRPNYIALTAGATYGCEGSNSDPPGGCTPPSPSLFKQVIDSGGTAVNYLGGAQSACDLTSSGRYAVKHAPWPYFADERGLCVANAPAVGSSGFLDPKHLPTLAFVSPDLCDDTHDCSIATGDNYLKTLLEPVLASSSYRAGRTAVIVVYDEFTPLPNVLMSKSVRPGTITAPVTHNLMLHTVESMLGLPWLVGTGDLRSASGL